MKKFTLVALAAAVCMFSTTAFAQDAPAENGGGKMKKHRVKKHIKKHVRKHRHKKSEGSDAASGDAGQ